MNTYLIIGIVIFISLAFWFIKKYKSFVSGMNNVVESQKLIILTDANFKAQTKSGIALVDFWADWCTPCKIQGPIINELAEEAKFDVKICKLDVQNNQRTAQELSIRSIPTIIIFKDGKVVKQLVGVKTKSVLEKTLREVIEN